MNRVKGLFKLLSIILCIFIGLWVAQDNSQEVTVYLLGFSLPELSLGLWLLLTLSLGIILGMLASLPLILTSRTRKNT